MNRILQLAAAVVLMGAVAACGSDKDNTAGDNYGAGNAGNDSSLNGTGNPGGDIRAGDLAGETQELKTRAGDTIRFGLNSDAISPEASEILQRQAAYMQKYPELTFSIEGHCDERGTREFNLALGQRRAEAAKTALISLGIAAQRLQTISYGKERPAVVGSSEAAWAQNRRDVTVIN